MAYWFLFPESKQVMVERVYCGTFMTSLEMAGASMTLLHIDDTLKRCLGEYVLMRKTWL
jgi:dihydroxyacetone kinase